MLLVEAKGKEISNTNAYVTDVLYGEDGGFYTQKDIHEKCF